MTQSDLENDERLSGWQTFSKVAAGLSMLYGRYVDRLCCYRCSSRSGACACLFGYVCMHRVPVCMCACQCVCVFLSVCVGGCLYV